MEPYTYYNPDGSTSVSKAACLRSTVLHLKAKPLVMTTLKYFKSLPNPELTIPNIVTLLQKFNRAIDAKKFLHGMQIICVLTENNTHVNFKFVPDQMYRTADTEDEVTQITQKIYQQIETLYESGIIVHLTSEGCIKVKLPNNPSPAAIDNNIYTLNSILLEEQWINKAAYIEHMNSGKLLLVHDPEKHRQSLQRKWIHPDELYPSIKGELGAQVFHANHQRRVLKPLGRQHDTN